MKAATMKADHETCLGFQTSPHVAIIDGPQVNGCIRNDPLFVKAATLDAFRAHYEGAYDQPTKLYLRRSAEAHTADRIIAMPVYLRNGAVTAGVKWIGSNHENFRRGLPRANALIVLSETESNTPIAIVSASMISAMRTMAVALIAIDRLNPEPRRVGIIGMGRLGRLLAEFLPGLYPSIARLRCFSARAPFDESAFGPAAERAATHQDALADADLIVTSTVAASPYIERRDLPETTTIINLSLMDFDLSVFEAANAIVVDDWGQCSRAEKVFKKGVDAGRIGRERVQELSSLLFGDGATTELGGLVMVNPIGMAIEDIFVARAVYNRLRVAGALSGFSLE